MKNTTSRSTGGGSDKNVAGGNAARKGCTIQKNPCKKAKGCGWKIAAPVEAIVRNATKLVQVAVRYQFMQEIVRIAAVTEGSDAFLEKLLVPISAYG